MNLDAFLDVVLRANLDTFKEVINMAKKKKTLEEALTELGLIPEWIERGVEQGKLEIAKAMLAKGWKTEDVVEITKIPKKKVKALVS